ncbi:hypothetical protein WMF37_26065 [Sorangium sp. So ce291]|uniref:hypothetical protein n=1 Tax=Sorangium sp. So ce291 TaxID=3133294 RepID=UPI003F63A052
MRLARLPGTSTPHAPREPGALLVTVEDDDALVSALRAVGAAVQLVGAHFRGEIPRDG